MNMPSHQPGAGTRRAVDRGDGKARVVVGIDGSPGSRAALVHGLIAAAHRGADLDVVTSYAIELYYLGGAPIDVPNVAGIRDDTQHRVRGLLEEVHQEVEVSAVSGVRDVQMRPIVSEVPAAQVLVDRSEGADLLVVGSRGRGAMRSALLGSVALHCVTHAACPVVVMHPSVGVSRPPRVVVGVDGSAAARAALAAAISEAGQMNAVVEAIVTYALADYWTDLATVFVPSAEEIRRDLQQRTERLVDDVLAELPMNGGSEAPSVRIVVLEGSAGDVLVDRGRTADLLVVGSRGRGALRGLLLGSVALHCAMHALCPVMVVHPLRNRSKAAPVSAEPVMADGWSRGTA